MSETSWFKCWRGDHTKGDHRFMPRSDAQGKQWAREKLAPLQAQISVFFGDPSGSLQALQDGASKLRKGEEILCQVCFQNIWNVGHRADCDIVEQYMKVMT